MASTEADPVSRSDWQTVDAPPELGDHDVHVWEVRLDHVASVSSCLAALTPAERDRAARFVTQDLRDRFIIAHGALRSILGGYLAMPPVRIDILAAEQGKPHVANAIGSAEPDLQFNLSHSGDIALVAVARGRAVGVDVEQWREQVEFMDIAGYCFSSREREALALLGGGTGGGQRGAPPGVAEAFFNAWSRKEAYLKAIGCGVTTGLDHFDVSMAPGETARVIEDRRDPLAGDRWAMRDVPMDVGYSAAVVVGRPCELFSCLLYPETGFRPA